MVRVYGEAVWISTDKVSVAELAIVEARCFDKAIREEYKVFQAIQFHWIFGNMAISIISKN